MRHKLRLDLLNGSIPMQPLQESEKTTPRDRPAVIKRVLAKRLPEELAQ
jgi:hypothetical protein